MDVIAAISTAPALSAIGIVRVSGAGCFAICDSVFQPTGGGLVCGGNRRFKVLGGLRLFNLTGHSVHLDDVVVLVLPAHGYSAHSNMLVTTVLIRQNSPVGR